MDFIVLSLSAKGGVTSWPDYSGRCQEMGTGVVAVRVLSSRIWFTTRAIASTGTMADTKIGRRKVALGKRGVLAPNGLVEPFAT